LNSVNLGRKKIALWELDRIKGIYGISIQAVTARARRLEAFQIVY